MAAGARCQQVEVVLDELGAARHVLARTNPGDLVVLCVDQHAMIAAELEERTKYAQAGAHVGDGEGSTSDPDLDPGTLTSSAAAEGTEASDEALATTPNEMEERVDDTAI